MKKLFALVVCCMAAFIISSCSDSAGNTPTAVAEKSMECLKNKDYKGYVDLMEIKAKDGASVEETKSGYVAMLSSKFQESEKKTGAMKDYQVLGEEVKDSTAVVKVAVNYEQKSDTTEVKLKMNKDGEWKLDTGK